MSPKPTDKNTKAEILTAYNQLVEEKKTIEAQLRTTQKETTTPVPTPTVKEEPKATMIAVPSQDKIAYTIVSLDSLQLGFGTAVSELSEKLTTEAAKLAEIRAGVATELTDLQTLHGLEVTEDLTRLLQVMRLVPKPSARNSEPEKKPFILQFKPKSKLGIKNRNSRELPSKNGSNSIAKLDSGRYKNTNTISTCTGRSIASKPNNNKPLWIEN
jgi:hypothetical protein